MRRIRTSAIFTTPSTVDIGWIGRLQRLIAWFIGRGITDMPQGEPIFKETSRKFNYVQEYNRGQDFEVRLDLWSSVDDTPPDQHISPGMMPKNARRIDFH